MEGKFAVSRNQPVVTVVSILNELPETPFQHNPSVVTEMGIPCYDGSRQTN